MKTKRMKKKDYSEMLRNAIKEKSFAGMQNMGDISKAVSYAKKNGFELEHDQQLRTLIASYGNETYLIFFLRLTNGNDVIVFNKGRIVPGKYCPETKWLETKPVSCDLLENFRRIK